jgi:hypothetical protein
VEIRTLTLNVVFSSAHLTVTSVMHIDPNVGSRDTDVQSMSGVEVRKQVALCSNSGKPFLHFKESVTSYYTFFHSINAKIHRKYLNFASSSGFFLDTCAVRQGSTK